ncbi:hypothetical protein Hanom_Chr07g00584911 [Helianthus anomalus]
MFVENLCDRLIFVFIIFNQYKTHLDNANITNQTNTNLRRGTLFRCNKKWSRKNQPGPRVRLRLEIHKHSNQPTHRLPKQKGRQLTILFTLANTNKIRQRRRSNLFHITNIRTDTLGPSVSEHIRRVYSVSPVCICDAYLLETPTGVVSISVVHEHDPFYWLCFV